MRETHTAQASIFDFYSEHEFGRFLKKLSDLLDEHPEILTLLAGDLIDVSVEQVGCKGLSVESVFRCLLLKKITGVSYDKLAFHLSDSLSYRTFARLDIKHAPGKSSLQANIRSIKPETFEAIFKTIAVKEFEDRGLDIDKLRIDSTVVKSNIAPPLDSQLLNDGVRVLSRYLTKSRDCTGINIRFKDYREKSRSLSAGIFYAKKAEKNALYEELIPLSQKVLSQTRNAITKVKLESRVDGAQLWIEKVEHYLNLFARVIDQTQRRIFDEEDVPASEKIVSLFESHTDIIIKGSRDIAYGHKLNLASDVRGLITGVKIEDGNPADTEIFLPLLKSHELLYGAMPTTVVADGGYASQDNLQKGKALGIKQVVFHKKRGITISKMGVREKTFRKLRAFRAGIEGNISELKRAFGAGKALWKGHDGFKADVLASVISYNLTRLVRLNSA